MTKPLLTLMAASACALALAACTHHSHPKSLPPGEYESYSSSSSPDGTNYSTRKTTEVELDKYGNKKATVTTKSTTDPTGLMNKKTTSTTRTY